MPNARRLAGNRFDAVHDIVGPADGRCIGQLHVDQQIALVLLGDELGRRAREAEISQPDEADIDDKHDRTRAQKPADEAGITLVRGVETAIERGEESAERPIDRAIEG